MGKKKEKSKGKGAEKTALKTEKNVLKKTKKLIAEKGEKNIKELVQEYSKADKSLQSSVEKKVAPPSRRSNASFTAHPDKDEIIMFGGEYFNGSQVVVYNDLLIYDIKQNDWSQIKSPISPPPRCSHQAAYLRRDGGQLWIFGGEFPSPTESQFYHFNDLWVFHFKNYEWEQISKPGGPCARSGHRMVSYKHQLIIFGGFHDYVSEFRYFNDIYAFDVDNYCWNKLTLSGTILPSPRSGCQLGVLSDNSSIVLYGGYSKEKVKKDVDKGVAHSDLFILTPDEAKDPIGTHWKCSLVKQRGKCPSSRSGFSMLCSPGNRAVLYGGVTDVDEEDENIKGVFYNDIYSLNIKDGSWHQIKLKGKKDKTRKSRRRKDKKNPSEDCEDVEMEEDLDVLEIKETSNTPTENEENDANTENNEDVFMPHPRMNALLTIRNNTLYLLGGIYENDDRQYTFCDFYSLDLMKLDEWKTINSDDINSMEWEESDDSSDEDDSDDDSNEDSSNDSDMEEENPPIFKDEDLSVYFDRTESYWLSQAKLVAEKEDIEASATLMQKAALRMCKEFFKNK